MSRSETTDPVITEPAELERRCELLRSLHVPGDPLVLPNAWDVASAKAVEAAGFPVVATTSGGVAASLGYEDHEGAPGDEMPAAAARICRSGDSPTTGDAARPAPTACSRSSCGRRTPCGSSFRRLQARSMSSASSGPLPSPSWPS